MTRFRSRADGSHYPITSRRGYQSSGTKYDDVWKKRRKILQYQQLATPINVRLYDYDDQPIHVKVVERITNPTDDTTFMRYNVTSGNQTLGSILAVGREDNKYVNIISLEGSKYYNTKVKGAGTFLVGKAVQLSFDKGWEGHVRVLSARSSSDFYKSLGFRNVDGDDQILEIKGVESRKLVDYVKSNYGGL